MSSYKQLTINNYQSAIINILLYFSFFGYPPTDKEIYRFLKKRLNFDRFKTIFKKMIKDSVVTRQSVKRYTLHVTRHTLEQYSIKEVKSLKLKVKSYNERFKISKEKLKNWRFRLYIKCLSFFPPIKLVGLSGTMAMMNAEENDDIDLFIITARNRLFTGRFIALVLAELLGLRRRRIFSRYKLHVTSYKNKVCLNLFFDESNLSVPKLKQTEYVAHEVLQMKPIINKDQTYKRFLETNRWVFKMFPNANSEFRIQSSELINKILNSKSIHNSRFIILNFGDFIESLVKKFQLSLIRKHQTTEIISNTQLWFHPQDFGKKIIRMELD